MSDTKQVIISRKAYLENSNTCPNCGSEDIEGNSFNADENYVIRDVYCEECGMVWTDEYTLSSIEDAYMPDNSDVTIIQ
jgi:uncharacterized Zn finger protein